MKIEDIIIRPGNFSVFTKKQGSLFWPHTYKYISSDGIKLRSREECDWHYILSRNGIYHTYEPNLSGTRRRPDFGTANNFLIELCGMVEAPFPKKSDAGRRKKYKKEMAEKRKEYLNRRYNVFEVYKEVIVLNGFVLKNIRDAAVSLVLRIIERYNPRCRGNTEDVAFWEINKN
ncbi:hypothetical protein KY335_01850 [Candidatus Woesearchaeota archaeon]|nr:hypothetical protein [Candidatus Woesearchaeota archaeon]